MEKEFPNKIVEGVTGKINTVTRGEYVDRFNTDHYTKAGELVAKGLDILIFTANVGSYGFNLAARCFRSVQFEPWMSASKEAQALARVFRGGQMNPLSEHLMLKDKRFKVEQVVVDMRNGRQAVSEEMYGIAE